ncbi:hypothetical protein Daesc_005406 [Daldinia eschscholtzii]|uniref:Uncharacterized protein n=1 Tax=Daldinia eschscholtzii TaxID=292717 RepID=A0AAX6MKV8_9PEZI
MDNDQNHNDNHATSGVDSPELNSAESIQASWDTLDTLIEPVASDNRPSRSENSRQTSERNEANPNSLLDRHNRAIAQILSHFRNMVMAATAPISEGGNVLELAALNRMTMETESAALISEVQGLLAISREMKALWIRGPLRQPGDNDNREAELDKRAAEVAQLYDRAIEMREAAIRRENAAKAGGDLSSRS